MFFRLENTKEANVKLTEEQIEQLSYFNYLGSDVTSNGKLERGEKENCVG